MSGSSDDRRVHAVTVHGSEIVRYNRAGKWFIEKPNVARKHISFRDAVKLASVEGSEVHYGLYGGSRFDKHVKIARDDD